MIPEKEEDKLFVFHCNSCECEIDDFTTTRQDAKSIEECPMCFGKDFCIHVELENYETLEQHLKTKEKELIGIKYQKHPLTNKVESVLKIIPDLTQKIKELTDNGADTQCLLDDARDEIKKLKQIFANAITKIRELPNRDDMIYSMLPDGKKASIAITDGGGVGRFEVIKIIEEEKQNENPT